MKNLVISWIRAFFSPKSLFCFLMASCSGGLLFFHIVTANLPEISVFNILISMFLFAIILSALHSFFSKNKELQNLSITLPPSTEHTTLIKSDFIASLSHELRNPLNSVLLLSENLAANLQGNLTEEQVEEARTIYSSGTTLFTLITDIVDLAKLEAGKITLTHEDLPIAQLIEELKKKFHPIMQHTPHRLHFSINESAPTHIKSDRIRTEQILRNLLFAVLKFSSRRHIDFTVHYVRTTQSIAFSILDNDPDFSAGSQDMVKIFELSKHAQAKSAGGIGLSLSIAHAFSLVLGGEIRAERIEDKGCRFTFSLPLSPHDAKNDRELPPSSQEDIASQAASPLATSLHFTGKKVLIVDDDMMNIYTMSKILKPLGFTIHAAENGAQALEVLKEHPSMDLVFMDIAMPIMDGYVAIKKMRENPKWVQIPVIVVTGRVEKENKEELLHIGASDYLAKPLDLEKLTSLLSLWLGGETA